MAIHAYDSRAYARGQQPGDMVQRWAAFLGGVPGYPELPVTQLHETPIIARVEGSPVDGAERNHILLQIPTTMEAPVGAAVAALSWSAIDADAGIDNQEILMRFRIRTDATGMGNVLVLRGSSDTPAAATGYLAGIEPGFGIRISKVNVGALTSLVSAAQTVHVDEWRWMRFRVNSNLIQLKSWPDSTSEPGSWSLSWTDNDITSGWMGFAPGWQDPSGIEIAYYSFATDTDTAVGPETLPLPMSHWCAIPSSSIALTAEISAGTANEGSETIWVSNHPLTTGDSDYPPNQDFLQILTNSGGWNTGLSADVGFGGIALRQPGSEILLDNELSSVDDWLERIEASFNQAYPYNGQQTRTLAGRTIRIRAGDPANDHRFFETVFTGIIGTGEPRITPEQAAIPVSALHPQLTQALDVKRYSGIPTGLRLHGTLGTNGYISVPSHAAYSVPSFAISWRVQRSKKPTATEFLAQRVNGATKQFEVSIQTDGYIRVDATSAAGTVTEITTAGIDICDNEIHVCGLYIVDQQQALLIVDGQKFDATVGTLNTLDTTSTAILWGNGLQGKIWDCRFYASPPDIEDFIAALDSRPQSVPANLVGWWPCDDSTGSAVTDYSTNANTGTVTGTVGTHFTWVATGEGSTEKAGQSMPVTVGAVYNEKADRHDADREAYRMSDGATARNLAVRAKGVAISSYFDYVAPNGKFPAGVRLDGVDDDLNATVNATTGDASIAIWFLPASSDTTLRYLMGWQNGALAGAFALRLNSGGTNRLSVTTVNNTPTVYNINYDSASALTWHRAVAVRDTANSLLLLYLDGELVGSTAIAGTFSTVLTAFRIGRRPDVASNYFPGSLYGATVWNRALTHKEVRADLERVYTGTEPNVKHLWKCDEDRGTTAFDSVTTGAVNLTLNAGAAFIGSIPGLADLSGPQNEPVCFDTMLTRPEDPGSHTPLLVRDLLVERSQLILHKDLDNEAFEAAKIVMPWTSGYRIDPGGSISSSKVFEDILGTAGACMIEDRDGRLGPSILMPPCTPGPYASIGAGIAIDDVEMLPCLEFLGHRRGGITLPPNAVYDDSSITHAFYIKPWAPSSDRSVPATYKFPSNQVILSTLTPGETGGMFIGFDAVNDGTIIYGHPGVTNSSGPDTGAHYTRSTPGAIQPGKWHLIICRSSGSDRRIEIWRGANSATSVASVVQSTTGSRTAGGPVTVGGGAGRGGYYGAMQFMVTYNISIVFLNLLTALPTDAASRVSYLNMSAPTSDGTITDAETGAVGRILGCRWAPRAHWNLDLLSTPNAGPCKFMRPAWKVLTGYQRNGYPLQEADFGAVSTAEKIRQRTPYLPAPYSNTSIRRDYAEAIVLDSLGGQSVQGAESATPVLPTRLLRQEHGAKVTGILAKRLAPEHVQLDLMNVDSAVLRLGLTDEVWLTSERLKLSPTCAFRVVSMAPSIRAGTGSSVIQATLGLWGGMPGSVDGDYVP